jgi:hypothetical protein
VSDSIAPDAEEHLATGWEPGLPAADTLIRQAVLLHASWPVTVAQALGRPWRRTDDWVGGFLADRGELSNPVFLLRPPTDLPALVAEVEEVVPATSPYFLVSAWQEPDLTPYGLVRIGYPPVMIRLPAPHEVPIRDGVEVREVLGPEDLATAERVLVEGFPMPGAEPLTAGDVLNPAMLGPDTRVWLALVDGEPAAVAAAHSHGGATLVEYVAALAVARGRGAGSAVTWAATLAWPGQPAILIASDDGRPVYESMGYVAIERWAAWSARRRRT